MGEYNDKNLQNRFKRYLHGKFHLRYFLRRVAAWLGVALVFKLTWNLLLPGLFGITAITFWQAFALIVLLRLTVMVAGFSRHRFFRIDVCRKDHTFNACHDGGGH